MPVTGTVTRGFTFSETTPITPSNLNSLGTPTVEIAGAVGTLSLDPGSIVNATVSATAAIDYSKLAALTGGNLLVGNSSNVATSVTMSGDCTMDNAGAVSIGEDKVTLEMIASGTEGDILYFGEDGAPTLLTKGAAGEVLKMNSGETAPEWGTDSAGKILQVKSSIKTGEQTISVDAFTDITDLSVTITPASTDNTILIMATVHGSAYGSVLNCKLVRVDSGSTDIGVSTVTSSQRTAGTFGSNSTQQAHVINAASFTMEDTPASTNELTYKVQADPTYAGTSYPLVINRSWDDDVAAATFSSSITVMEISA